MKFLRTLDIYLLRLSCGTLGTVVAIIMSLMVLEHLPRLIDITSLSGHRGYIVGQTVLGLVPEYAGIGTVFGLYLAIALTVRKLALRGELDVIEAMGIAPRRWLRVPIALTLLAAGFVLVNQGWLMPAGEQRIDDIGRRMTAGDFGFNLSAHEFHSMGDDIVLKFDGINPENGRLAGIFVRTADGVFQAGSGSLSLSSDREPILQLRHGQLIEPAGRVLSFEAIDVRLPRIARADHGPTETDTVWRTEPIGSLIASSNPAPLRIACARLLWVLLLPLAAALAITLGRPPLRSNSALGLFVGLCFLIGLVKSIDWYAGLHTAHPVAEAGMLGCLWLALVAMVPRWRESAHSLTAAKAWRKIGMRPFARGLATPLPPFVRTNPLHPDRQRTALPSNSGRSRPEC